MISSLRHRWFFAYRIHRLKEWTLEGIKLGTADLSLSMKATMVRSSYEAAEAAACSNLIRPGDRILELGGAIGFIGLHCLINCQAESVVSVEANPKTVHRLRENYVRNGRTAQVISAAVTEEPGPTEFKIGSDFWNDGLHANCAEHERIIVEGKPFSMLWKEVGNLPNVLIADIEGAETLIDWAMLPIEIETIIIETHPLISGYPTASRVLKTILNGGFEVYFARGDVFGLKRAREL